VSASSCKVGRGGCSQGAYAATSPKEPAMSTDTTTVQPRSSSSQSIPPRGPARRPLTRWIVGGAGIALVGLVIGLAGGAASKGSSDPTGPKIEAVGTDLGQPAAELDQSGDTPVMEQLAVEVDQAGDS